MDVIPGIILTHATRPEFTRVSEIFFANETLGVVTNIVSRLFISILKECAMKINVI